MQKIHGQFWAEVAHGDYSNQSAAARWRRAADHPLAQPARRSDQGCRPAERRAPGGPSHAVGHDDYVQATTYRHDLAKQLNKPMQVLIVGGRRSADFPIQNREPDVDAMSFSDVVASARRQLEWQLRHRE